MRHTGNRRLHGGRAKPNMIRSRIFNGSIMQHDQDNREGTAAAPAKDSRKDRLKQKLRENLKRRKSQAKERNDLAAAPSGNADAFLDDAGDEPGR
jgi:hypothetical protein